MNGSFNCFLFQWCGGNRIEEGLGEGIFSTPVCVLGV